MGAPQPPAVLLQLLVERAAVVGRRLDSGFLFTSRTRHHLDTVQRLWLTKVSVNNRFYFVVEVEFEVGVLLEDFLRKKA